MKFHRSAFVIVMLLAFLACIATGSVQDTDDGGITSTLETDLAVGMSIPAGPEQVTYSFTTTFESKREQTICIYFWSTNDSRWERRAFVNSYYQGAQSTLRIKLAPDTKILIVGWYKSAGFPESRVLDWAQSHFDQSEVSKITADHPLPLASVTFTDGADGTATVDLKPSQSDKAK